MGDMTHAPLAAPSRAERRQLAVMFCDLVGSTLLSTSLDPEELLEVVGRYQAAVAASVQRFGGFVARYLGDGVLIYFGWPRADETQAERAARAALAVVTAVSRISVQGEILRVRIGIASGLVVVGDITGPAAVQEQAVVGEAPNLASRLQALAEPNDIVICHSTRTQIGELFQCDDLGLLKIKGYAEPKHTWRVRGISEVRSRFEALHPSKRNPIIDREEQLDHLLRRWHAAKCGKGRVVLVAGEPGIGKSRLIAALKERLHDEPHTTIQYFCSPHHQDSSLYPIIGHLEHAAGFARGDTAGVKVHKLRELFAEINRAGEDFALIADLLSLAADDRPPLNLSPQRRKEKTFAALIRQLEWLSGRQPVLLLLEDAQWCDPTSLELIDLTIDRAHSFPLLLIVTFRPDFQARWISRPGASLITVGRLDTEQSAAMVAQIMRGGAFSGDLIDRIVAQSDGVPLFIEELTKAVLESDELREVGHAALARLRVPNTLQGLLMARLDRFPPAREVAQIGSVIGREFAHALLSDVVQMPEATLLEGLEHLVASELVFRRGLPPDAVYTFKHALVQDTAYESILKLNRSTIHGKVVHALLTGTPDIEDTQPGVLARHCAQAGLIEKAASYYRRAGERSAERAALAETRNQLGQGLTLVSSLPHSASRRFLEVELKLALGRVLLSIKGSADVEAGNVFGEALELCRGLDQLELLTRALWGYWFNRAHRQDLTNDETAAQELLSLSHGQKEHPTQIVAQTMLGVTRFWQGRFPEGRSNLQTALELCKSGAHRSLDLAIVSNHLDDHVRMQLSLTLACLGHLQQSAAEAAVGVRSVLAAPHLPLRAIALAVKCRRDWFVRDDSGLRDTATALVTLSEEQGFPFYLAVGRCHLGWLTAKGGGIEVGLNLLRSGYTALQSTHAMIWQPYFLSMMAEAQGWAGNIDQAQRLLEAALEISSQTGGVWFNAELYRRKGEVELMRPPSAHQSAEECFWQSITIARRQSAKLWELKAATSLARLWSGQGKRTEARDLLGPVHACFAKGVGAPDIQDAAALLAELVA
jgi:class 3 adenylate cyclase/predicted ATPase